MEIQVFSDCHLEFHNSVESIWDVVTPEASVAVIPGDISASDFEEAAYEISKKFDHVIAVLGNHDFYRKQHNWEPKNLPDNFHLLNPGVFELDDVVFIGATLWTDFKDGDWFVMKTAKDFINDFHSIRDFEPKIAFDLHCYQKAYIGKMLEKYRGKKIVVVTHFVPSYNLIHEKWRVRDDEINYYFSANCNDLINKCDAGTVWAYGHTHDHTEESFGGLVFIANPIGYPNEKSKHHQIIIKV